MTKQLFRLDNEPVNDAELIITDSSGHFVAFISGGDGEWSTITGYECIENMDWNWIVDLLHTDYGSNMYMEPVGTVVKQSAQYSNMEPVTSGLYDPFDLVADTPEPDDEGIYIISIDRRFPPYSFSVYAAEKSYNGEDYDWGFVGSTKAYSWDEIKKSWCSDKHRVTMQLITTDDGNGINHA